VRATPWLIVEAKETKDSTAIVMIENNKVWQGITPLMFILHNNRQEWDLISEAVTPLLDGQE
jgi:hypothetical protein